MESGDERTAQNNNTDDFHDTFNDWKEGKGEEGEKAEEGEVEKEEKSSSHPTQSLIPIQSTFKTPSPVSQGNDEWLENVKKQLSDNHTQFLSTLYRKVHLGEYNNLDEKYAKSFSDVLMSLFSKLEIVKQQLEEQIGQKNEDETTIKNKKIELARVTLSLFFLTEVVAQLIGTSDSTQLLANDGTLAAVGKGEVGEEGEEGEEGKGKKEKNVESNQNQSNSKNALNVYENAREDQTKRSIDKKPSLVRTFYPKLIDSLTDLSDNSIVSRIKEQVKNLKSVSMKRGEIGNEDNQRDKMDKIMKDIDKNVNLLEGYEMKIDNKDLSHSQMNNRSPSFSSSSSPFPSPPLSPPSLQMSNFGGVSGDSSFMKSASIGREGIGQLTYGTQNPISYMSQGLKYLDNIKRLYSETKQKLALMERNNETKSGDSERMRLERQLNKKIREITEVKEIDVKQLEYIFKSKQEELDRIKLGLVEIKDELSKMDQKYSETEVLKDMQRLKVHERENKEFHIQELESELRDIKKRILASRGEGGGLSAKEKIQREIQGLQTELANDDANNNNVYELKNALRLLESNQRQAHVEVGKLKLSERQKNSIESRRSLEKLASLNEESSNAVYRWRKQSNSFSDEMNDIKGQLNTIDKANPYSLKKWRMELDKMERKLQERAMEVDKAHKCMKPLEVIGSKFSPKFNPIVLDRLNLKFDNLESSLNMMENSFINDFVRLTNGFINQFHNDRKKGMEQSDRMQQQRELDIQVRKENIRLDDINKEKERAERMNLKEIDDRAKQERMEEITDYYRGRINNESIQLSKEQIERAEIVSDKKFKPFPRVEGDEAINTGVDDELHHLLIYILNASLYVQKRFESLIRKGDDEKKILLLDDFLNLLKEISNKVRIFGKSNKLKESSTDLVDKFKGIIFDLHDQLQKLYPSKNSYDDKNETVIRKGLDKIGDEADQRLKDIIPRLKNETGEEN